MLKIQTLLTTAVLFVGGATIVLPASAQSAADCTKFVNIATGKGKIASRVKPAKDLGNIISRLEPGDVVCIAQGEYLGRGERGVDDIEVPVSIIGGYNSDFTVRDPWGAHRTIFTGRHNSDNFETQTRLSIDTSKFATRLMEARGEPTAHVIVVDGIIFDNGPRNYYKNADEAMIVRKGTASHTPTPESGALGIKTGINSTVTLQNNIAINFAPTEGVFSLFGGKGAKVLVRNNLAANNTGSGFRIGTGFTGDDVPHYVVEGNVSLFNQKHSAFGTFGGSGIMLESSTQVEVINNVFAFNDNYGVDNTKRSKALILNDNIIAANANADYVEFDLKMDVDEIEDESDLTDEADSNSGDAPKVNVSEGWAALYASRNVIDRNAAEEDVKAAKGWANDVRSMFGLNLQAADLMVDSPVWLPRLSIDDAVALATMYGDAGVTKP